MQLFAEEKSRNQEASVWITTLLKTVPYVSRLPTMQHLLNYLVPILLAFTMVKAFKEAAQNDTFPAGKKARAMKKRLIFINKDHSIHHNTFDDGIDAYSSPGFGTPYHPNMYPNHPAAHPKISRVFGHFLSDVKFETMIKAIIPIPFCQFKDSPCKNILKPYDVWVTEIWLENRVIFCMQTDYSWSKLDNLGWKWGIFGSKLDNCSSKLVKFCLLNIWSEFFGQNKTIFGQNWPTFLILNKLCSKLTYFWSKQVHFYLWNFTRLASSNLVAQ